MRYYLRAMYTPTLFPLVEKDIYLLNPARIKPNTNQAYSLEATVGGLMGYRTSQSKVLVNFASNVYNPGDIVKI